MSEELGLIEWVQAQSVYPVTVADDKACQDASYGPNPKDVVNIALVFFQVCRIFVENTIFVDSEVEVSIDGPSMRVQHKWRY